MHDTCFNYHATREYLEAACAHYQKTAPALADWLDELYVKLSEKPREVSVWELMQLNQLRLYGEWEDPNYAQNRWYKVRAELNQERGTLSY